MGRLLIGGLVECVKKGSEHKSTTFHKYAYDELEIEQIDTLKKLKIDHSTYETFLDLSLSSSSSNTFGSTTYHTNNNFWLQHTRGNNDFTDV